MDVLESWKNKHLKKSNKVKIVILVLVIGLLPYCFSFFSYRAVEGHLGEGTLGKPNLAYIIVDRTHFQSPKVVFFPKNIEDDFSYKGLSIFYKGQEVDFSNSSVIAMASMDKKFEIEFDKNDFELSTEYKSGIVGLFGPVPYFKSYQIEAPKARILYRMRGEQEIDLESAMKEEHFPKRLRSLIDQADKLVIREGQFTEGKVLFESQERSVLDEFSKIFEGFVGFEVEACVSTVPMFVHLSRGGEETLQISCLGNRIEFLTLGKDPLRRQIIIANREEWVQFFEKRGFVRFRESYENDKKFDKEWRAGILRGAPDCLLPVLSRQVEARIKKSELFKGNSLLIALDEAIAQKGEKIKALLKWNAASPWETGYRGAGLANGLLANFQIKDIVEVIQRNISNEEIKEGAAQLFASKSFKASYRKDVRVLVPLDLRERLWDYVESTDDKEKLKLASENFKPLEFK